MQQPSDVCRTSNSSRRLFRFDVAIVENATVHDVFLVYRYFYSGSYMSNIRVLLTVYLLLIGSDNRFTHPLDSYVGFVFDPHPVISPSNTTTESNTLHVDDSVWPYLRSLGRPS